MHFTKATLVSVHCTKATLASVHFNKASLACNQLASRKCLFLGGFFTKKALEGRSQTGSGTPLMDAKGEGFAYVVLVCLLQKFQTTSQYLCQQRCTGRGREDGWYIDG